jgi:hypothetical protein
MHLSPIAAVLLTPILDVAAMSSSNKHREPSRNWAGVNSFFLHAFPQYVQSLLRTSGIELRTFQLIFRH